MYREARGWCLFTLLVSSSVLHTLAYPHQSPQYISGTAFVPSRTVQQTPSHSPQLPLQRIERKFAEKPNAIKKASVDDFSDIQSNEIADSTGGGGFSWSNLLAMIMHMIFNPGAPQGANKSEGLDDTSVAPSPWANLLSMGLKILTALLGGGGTGGDGIDKVDNGGSPLQGVLAAVFSSLIGTRDPQQVNLLARQAGEFINIIINLLDALKTSFSHRSMAARNLGKKDILSDAAVASISMLKGYMRSMSSSSGKCMQRAMCEANRECTSDVGHSSLLCPLGSYAASTLLERSSTEALLIHEAGKRGRSGINCRELYLECNEVV